MAVSIKLMIFTWTRTPRAPSAGPRSPRQWWSPAPTSAHLAGTCSTADSSWQENMSTQLAPSTSVWILSSRAAWEVTQAKMVNCCITLLHSVAACLVSPMSTTNSCCARSARNDLHGYFWICVSKVKSKLKVNYVVIMTSAWTMLKFDWFIWFFCFLFQNLFYFHFLFCLLFIFFLLLFFFFFFFFFYQTYGTGTWDYLNFFIFLNIFLFTLLHYPLRKIWLALPGEGYSIRKSRAALLVRWLCSTCDKKAFCFSLLHELLRVPRWTLTPCYTSRFACMVENYRPNLISNGSLPLDLRHRSTLSSFKAKLKTFRFSQYFRPN